MNSIRVLLVEDDPNLGQILQEYLILKGYETHLMRDGEAGWQAFRGTEFHLCILDVMMPKKDGFTLAKEIRKSNQEIPIIFLTAKSMKEDTLEGFRIGADDYMTKPFSMEELLLRIRAILRRSLPQKPEEIEQRVYKIGKLEYDADLQILLTPHGRHKLTGKEAELLKMFFQNLNKTVDRNMALRDIWGDDSYFNARSMDVYISKLRKLLKEDDSLQLLTLHGQGFKLVLV